MYVYCFIEQRWTCYTHTHTHIPYQFNFDSLEWNFILCMRCISVLRLQNQQYQWQFFYYRHNFVVYLSRSFRWWERQTDEGRKRRISSLLVVIFGRTHVKHTPTPHDVSHIHGYVCLCVCVCGMTVRPRHAYDSLYLAQGCSSSGSLTVCAMFLVVPRRHICI